MAENLNISVLLEFYGEMLTEKQREVVGLYYNEDLSLAEIAELSGITRQGVRDSIKRAEFQLQDCEYRLGLVTRFHVIQKALDEIVDNAAQVQAENNRCVYSDIISDKAQRIIEVASNINI